MEEMRNVIPWWGDEFDGPCNKFVWSTTENGHRYKGRLPVCCNCGWPAHEGNSFMKSGVCMKCAAKGVDVVRAVQLDAQIAGQELQQMAIVREALRRAKDAT